MKLMFVFLVLSVNSLHADVNAVAEMLSKASRLGDLNTIKILLSSAVSPDLPDCYGQTPLYYAAFFGETKAVELLLTFHADSNAQVNSWGNASLGPVTPLQ